MRAFAKFAIILLFCLSMQGFAYCDPASLSVHNLAQLVLRKEAVRLHFYFTMETYVQANVVHDVYSSILPNVKYDSLADIIAAFKKANPDAIVFLDSKHADVLHIVDASVKGQIDYPLTNLAQSFSFNGLMSDLPEAIGKADGMTISCGNFSGSLVSYSDGLSSNVVITPSKDNFRTVLTDVAYSKRNGTDFGLLWHFSIQIDSATSKISRFIRFD